MDCPVATDSPAIPFSTPAPLLDEAMGIFKTLLRFDTSNPPGQEKECADWCVEQLRKAGVTDIKVFDATTDECVSCCPFVRAYTHRTNFACLSGSACLDVDVRMVHFENTSLPCVHMHGRPLVHCGARSLRACLARFLNRKT